MIYRVFDSNGTQLQEVNDANWPMIKEDERIPLVVNGKEGLYKVVKVGDANVSRDNKLVWDIWVQ